MYRVPSNPTIPGSVRSLSWSPRSGEHRTRQDPSSHKLRRSSTRVHRTCSRPRAARNVVSTGIGYLQRSVRGVAATWGRSSTSSPWGDAAKGEAAPGGGGSRCGDRRVQGNCMRPRSPASAWGRVVIRRLKSTEYGPRSATVGHASGVKRPAPWRITSRPGFEKRECSPRRIPPRTYCRYQGRAEKASPGGCPESAAESRSRSALGAGRSRETETLSELLGKSAAGRSISLILYIALPDYSVRPPRGSRRTAVTRRVCEPPRGWKYGGKPCDDVRLPPRPVRPRGNRRARRCGCPAVRRRDREDSSSARGRSWSSTAGRCRTSGVVSATTRPKARR